jgi:hypothetical protein
MLRVYYIGTDNNIHEFFCATNDSWTCLNAAPDQSPAWSSSDTMGPGAIGAIGWQNQVRMYYLYAGNVIQADLDGGTWTSQILSGA